ncbi:hypothetical protein EDB19DRAFT_1919449 [Suillus lakei]|nr:hypothetical protein EDB19DRAFT_1919449 [Suillus lakei]
MDPISIIASGLTVLQLIQTIAQASVLLLEYVASVPNADSSCQSLLNEFSSICSVLITVMEIEKDTSLPDNLRSALSNLTAKDGPVANLLLELKNILPNEQAWESGKMKMISRLTWPFKEKEAGAIIDRLKNYCGKITNILVIDTWNMLKEVKLEVQQVNQKLQEVDLGVQEGNRGVKELKRDSAAQKLSPYPVQTKFLQWMSPVSCTERHDTSCRQRNLETGHWIFHADQYVTWNKSDRAFLWLNGQPGHGKTIFASAVIDEVQGEGKATLAYFYCNFQDDRTTIAAVILHALIVQLLRQ